MSRGSNPRPGSVSFDMFSRTKLLYLVTASIPRQKRRERTRILLLTLSLLSLYLLFSLLSESCAEISFYLSFCFPIAIPARYAEKEAADMNIR